MPVYTARNPTGSLKSSTHLLNRGIDMRSGTPTSIAVVGFAHYRQLAYSTYISNISTFLQATILGQPLSTMKQFHKVVVKMSEQIDLPTPVTVIRFKSVIGSEEEQAFQRLGGSIEMVGKGGKEQMLKFRKLDTEILKEVVRIKSDVIKDAPALFGQVNLDGFQAYLKARSIITAFLQTQYYPAFSGPADRPPPISAFESIQGLMELKRKILEDHPSRGPGGSDSELEGEMEIDREDEDGEYEISKFYDVPRAHPPPEKSLGYGPVSTVPTTTGNVFPYFPTLLEDDPTFIAGVCQQYFIAAFGDDPAENTKEFLKFRSTISSCGQSEAGHVLNHIFMGIKLAIETQGRLYVIIQSQNYQGFSLHGYYYTMHVGGIEYAPDSSEVVLSEIRSIDEHAVALAEILQILAKSKGGKALVKGKKVADFEKPRVLRSFIQKFDKLTQEETRQIDERSGRLVFPQVFWRYSVDNVLKAVDLLVSETEPGDEYPMYVAGGVLTTEQIELSIFALFGDHGFSMIVPGGTGRKIPKSIEEDTLYKPYKDPKSKKTKTPSWNFVLAKKDIRACRADWLTFMGNHTWVTREQRSSQFRSELYTGVDAKNLYYGLIRALPDLEKDNTETPVVPPVLVGGKKKRDEEDEFDLSNFL